jgi:hypothetical protein
VIPLEAGVKLTKIQKLEKKWLVASILIIIACACVVSGDSHSPGMKAT